MVVIFRYDDFSADRPIERDSNDVRRSIWEAEKEITALFRKHTLPHVLGVVPCVNTEDGYERPFRKVSGRIPLSDDAEKCQFLRDGVRDHVIEVAMHGFEHTNHAPSRWAAAEFQRSFEQQRADLRAGREELKRALGEIRIETFIPPFNGWDAGTLPALEETSFTLLSADYREPLSQETRVRQVPFTAQLWELEARLEDLEAEGASGLIVVLYHPPQIVKMPGREARYFGAHRFEALLERLVSNPKIRITTFQGLEGGSETDGPLDRNRYQAAHRAWWHQAIWGRWWSPQPSWRSVVYQSAAEYQQAAIRGLSRLVLGTAIALGMGAALAILLKPWLGSTMNGMVVVAMGAGCLLAGGRMWEVQRRGFVVTVAMMAPLPFGLGFVVGWLLR